MNPNIFLADAVVPTWAAFVGAVVLVASVAGNWAQVVMARRKEKEPPQPFRVELEREFTSNIEFHRHLEDNKREHENLFSKIGGVERGMGNKLDAKFTEMQRSAEEGREKLHNRVNDVLTAVSQLQGELRAKRRHE